MSMDLKEGQFDVVVSLETIAHVEDQSAFCARVARLLSNRGHFIVTAQNGPVWESSGELRRPPEILQDLLTMRQLKGLIRRDFNLLQAGTIIPFGNRGLMRVVNSVKVNQLFGTVFNPDQILRFKEKMGWGHTLFALAQKRA